MTETLEPNRIVVADCIKLLGRELLPQADLIFADPPFYIGDKYDGNEDRWATSCLPCEKAVP